MNLESDVKDSPAGFPTKELIKNRDRNSLNSPRKNATQTPKIVKKTLRPTSAIKNSDPPMERILVRPSSASMQGRRRSRVNYVVKFEPIWNRDVTRSDRDELTRMLDNRISKSRDANKAAIPPKYDPKSKLQMSQSWKIRTPLKTSGAILNLPLVQKLYNPPTNQIHPDDLDGFEGYKFGSDRYNTETTARPRSAVDKSSAALRRSLRSCAPKQFDHIEVFKDISTLKNSVGGYV